MKNLADVRPYDLLLVDTMNLLARSYHGIKLSYNGKSTGMMYGFMNAVLSWRCVHPNAKVYLLWEGRLSVRKQKHPFYKAKRQMRIIDNDFSDRLEEVKTLVPLLGVTECRHIGLEADDLAAHFVGASSNDKVLMVSTDQDWWMYTNDRAHIQCRNTTYTRAMLATKLGFDPNKLDLWKVLKGDKSDEIPGIPRFPTKLADWLARNCETHFEFENKLREFGEHRWADRVRDHEWLIDQNADLIMPKHVDPHHLEVKKGTWDKSAICDILAENGMTKMLQHSELL